MPVDQTEDTLPLPPQETGGFLDDAPSAPLLPEETDRQGAENLSISMQDMTVGPYQVLARKYRPQTFEDLIGQETLVRILRRAFEVGRVAHAFMLTGVRGVGKTTTARIIARALNCVGVDGKGGPTAEPCGVCPNCVAILADRHPDVLEMDAASRTGVDDVREIIEATRYRPMQARKKVFIIDEVHMLSRNAFNALLKTLEEPPEQVTFIFATTELRKVPVTVLSRCQRFDLQRVPQAMLAEHFDRIAQKEGTKLSENALALIARAADGSVRDGLSLLDQALAQGATDAQSVSHMMGLADRAMVFDLLDAVMGGRAEEALTLTGRAYAGGADLAVLLNDLMESLHLLSRLKLLPALRHGTELTEMEKQRGGALADQLSMGVIGRAWQILLKGLAEVETAPERRQAVEMILIRLCYASLLPTPDRIIRQLGQRQTHPQESAPALTPARVQGGASTSPARSSASSAPSTSSNVASGDKREVPPVGSGQGGGSGMRLVANGGVVMSSAPEANLSPKIAPEIQHQTYDEPDVVQDNRQDVPSEHLPAPVAPPMPRSWREIVALSQKMKRAWLHGHLRSAAHLVALTPPADGQKGVLKIRFDLPDKRRALKELSGLLDEMFPSYWQVEASSEQGMPSLDEQGEQVSVEQREKAAAHPLVQAILKSFPGAILGDIRDPSLDDYGLPSEKEEKEIFLGEDMAPCLEFAPLDAEERAESDLD